MGSFLSFDKMIMPVIIKVVFWLSMIGSIVFGLVMIGYGIISSSGGFYQIIIGLLSLVLGPVIVRLYCELLIVTFKVQESLVDIRDLLKNQKELNNDAKEAA